PPRPSPRRARREHVRAHLSAAAAARRRARRMRPPRRLPRPHPAVRNRPGSARPRPWPPPCRSRAPRRGGSTAPPNPPARRRRSCRSTRMPPGARGSRPAAAGYTEGRMLWGGPRRAARHGRLRRGPPRCSRDRALSCRAYLRLDRTLLPVPAHAREDLVQPDCGLILVHLLRVHELGGEDLLRLHEHLLLAGGQAFLVVTQREVPDDLGELEDVAGL